MIVSRIKRAGIAMGAMIVLSLGIAGFSVAQLQAGLETPSEAAIVAAEQKVRGTDHQRPLLNTLRSECR